MNQVANIELAQYKSPLWYKFVVVDSVNTCLVKASMISKVTSQKIFPIISAENTNSHFVRGSTYHSMANLLFGLDYFARLKSQTDLLLLLNPNQ